MRAELLRRLVADPAAGDEERVTPDHRNTGMADPSGMPTGACLGLKFDPSAPARSALLRRETTGGDGHAHDEQRHGTGERDWRPAGNGDGGI